MLLCKACSVHKASKDTVCSGCVQMLHERIRHYKKELNEAHATNTVHEKHISRLQTEIKRLHDTFQVVLVSKFCHT